MKRDAINKTEDIEIPDELDFRSGERGKYAYRFGEIARDEELAAEFLRSRGLAVEKIDTDRFAKTPDFRLLKDGQVVAYCEVKTFERDVWLDKMLAEAPPGTLAGGARPDPIYNRMSNAIHTAVKQLQSVNPNRVLLNILVLVNRDKLASWKDLISVTTGKWDPLAGVHDATHTQFSEGRIRKEKYEIDLYLWLDAYHETRPADDRYIFGDPANRLKVCSLFGISPELIRTVA